MFLCLLNEISFRCKDDVGDSNGIGDIDVSVSIHVCSFQDNIRGI